MKKYKHIIRLWNRDNFDKSKYDSSHHGFGWTYNNPLKPGDIPYGITHLEFRESFNRILKPGDIPNSVTYLAFGSDFDRHLKPGDIPDSVTHLVYYPRPEIWSVFIPKTVKYINYRARHNQPLILPIPIPNFITRLSLTGFNQPLNRGDIPDSVTHLELGHRFNQPLKIGAIPKSVTHLDLGTSFNQPLEPGIIPSSITHLIFGWNFLERIRFGDIPNSVTHLEIFTMFEPLVEKGVIPNSVTHLYFYNNPLDLAVIPDSIVYIKTHSRIDQDILDTIFIDYIGMNRTYKTYNKWTFTSCKYFQDNTLQRDVFVSKINSSILNELPNELLFFLMEYPIKNC